MNKKWPRITEKEGKNIELLRCRWEIENRREERKGRSNQDFDL